MLSTIKSNENLIYNYSYWYKFAYAKRGSFFFFALLPKFQNNSKLFYLSSNLSSKFNIFFIRKEVFYTKLKYSRVPQFDTSAGAAASFMSGMYGFMVSEKYGFELIDSGDFLFLILFVSFLVLIGSTITALFNARTSLVHDFISSLKSFW